MSRTLFERGFIIGESKIHMKSDRRDAILSALKEIKRQRRELKDYVRRHPEFLYSLTPVEETDVAPKIVQKMIEASMVANVGPMASVGGAIADIGVEAMLNSSARTAIVEDGGEVSISSESEITISILSEDYSLSGKIGFLISKEDSPLGISTSSSKTGRVLSLGDADSVTVVARDAALADAAATAICNEVLGTYPSESILNGLKKAQEIKGVRGVIIIREGLVGVWGRIPRIVKIKQ
ncbi:MAG: UPF0280 family protein [Nitrososphaerota archaeon]|nr:UPF0280 family protein [Candidatus Bathyarchaeota archaeon]MDW8048475.1 UPF0280 family protein [Nitrososphaerota archaeon]